MRSLSLALLGYFWVASAGADERILDAARRRDATAMARAANVVPLGVIVRMLSHDTRFARLAALRAVRYRDDRLLLLELLAQLSGSPDHDTARAAAHALRDMVEAADPLDWERWEIGSGSFDRMSEALLSVCARSSSPEVARVEALTALFAIDHLTVADTADACLAILASSRHPVLRLAAVEVLASFAPESQAIAAFAHDADAEVGASALLAECLEHGLPASDSRLANLSPSVDPLLLAELRRCVRAGPTSRRD